MHDTLFAVPLALLATLACPRTSAVAALAAPAAAACPADQKVLFTCSLTPVKAGQAPEAIAVCGLPESTAARVQVRWGPQGPKQSVFPDAAVPASEVLKYSRYTRPQTTYLALTFTLSGVTYTVYDDEDMGRTARGLRIQRAGGAQEDRACQGTVTGSLMAAEDLLPPGLGE